MNNIGTISYSNFNALVEMKTKFYEYFEDEIYRPSPEYNRLREKQSKLYDDIENQLNMSNIFRHIPFMDCILKMS